MFNGIIQKVGNIKNIKQINGGAQFIFTIDNDFLTDVKIGDSIASNGVCLTVIKIIDNYFYADLSNETLTITTFNTAQINDKINFEKALRFNQGIDGHLVSGHIDSVAEIVDKVSNGDNTIFKIKIAQNLTKYIVKKGSITINGISLTVNQIKQDIFSVNIVPHTLKSTNLNNLKKQKLVNIEVDIIARQLEKLITK